MHVVLALLLTASTDRVAASVPQPSKVSSETQSHDGARDFDFLVGNWKVGNRRLHERLADSHDWIVFQADDSFHFLPGGLGTEENYRTEHWKDFFALGLHLYDPRKKQWTLYWADTLNAPGTMQTLAIGKFSNGVGTFYAPDTFNGKPITVRILWKQIDAIHTRWEQAFSADKGVTWETNWTMDFTRQ